MKTGNIILEVTQGLDVELGQLRWHTVKRIVEKHIDEARKELLRVAAFERETITNLDISADELSNAVRITKERRSENRGEKYVVFERIKP